MLGDDSYDHTITDKVQAYNPREKAWTVEVSLTSPRHKVNYVIRPEFSLKQQRCKTYIPFLYLT